MSGELTLSLRLKADGSGFVGQVRASREELERLTAAAAKAGAAASNAGDTLERSGRSAKAAGAAAAAVSAEAGRTGKNFAQMSTAAVGAAAGLDRAAGSARNAGTASAAAAGEAARMTRTLGGLETGAAAAAADLARAGRGARDAGSAARGAASGVQTLGGAFGDLKAMLLGLGLIETGRAIADTGMKLQGLQNALTVLTGSSSAAAEAQGFIREQAERLGLVNLDLQKSYVQLEAAAKGTRMEGITVRQLFVGMAEAGTVLNLSADDMRGTFTALTQIMSKGKLAAEEIRGQIGERLPGAFQIAARAMGLTTQELDKMLQNGQIMSDEFIPRFAAELRREFAGGVSEASASARADLNRFANAWTEAQAAIAKSGFLAGLASGARDFSAALKRLSDDGTLRAFGTALGEIIGYVGKHLGQIAALASAYAAFRGTTLGLTAATSGFRVAVALLNAEMKLSPIGLVASAVAAVVGGMVAYMASSDEASTATGRLASATRDLDAVMGKSVQTMEDEVAAKRKVAEQALSAAIAYRQELAAAIALEQQRQASRKVRAGGYGTNDTISLGIDAGQNRIAALQAESAKNEAEIKAAIAALEKLKNRKPEEAPKTLPDWTPPPSSGALKKLDHQREALAKLREEAGLVAKGTLAMKEAEELYASAAAASIPKEQKKAELAKIRARLMPVEADFMAKWNKEAQNQIKLIGLSAAAREAELAVQKALAEAERENIALSADAQESIRKTAFAHAMAAEAANKRVEAERKAAEEFTQIWRNAAESARRSLTDAIEGTLSGHIKSIGDLSKSILSIGRRATAETLSALAFTGGKIPEGATLGPFGSAIASLFGAQQKDTPPLRQVDAIKGGGFATVQDAIDGKPMQPVTFDYIDGKPPLTGFSKGLASVFSGVKETFKPFARGLDKIFKPVTDLFKGALGTGLKEGLGKAFGGSQVGAMVAGVANAFGIKLSNTGSQIGGAIGSFLPIPGGSLIGSLAGGIIGSLFKGQTHKADVRLTSSNGQAAVGSSFQFKDKDGSLLKAASVAGNSFAAAMNSILDQLGGLLKNNVNLGFVGQVNGKWGFGTGDHINKSDAIYESAEQAVQAALGHAFANADSVFSNLSDHVKSALKQWSSNIDKAVSEALKVQALEKWISSIKKPMQALFNDFETQAQQRVQAARKYGFDLVEIEKLNGQQRAKLLEQQKQQMTGGLKSLLDDLRLGGRSEGSGLERLHALETRRDGLLAKAQSGDQDAINQVTDLSGQIVDLSKSLFGTTGGYADERASTESLVSSLLDQLDAKLNQASEDALLEARNQTAQLMTANGSLDELIRATQANGAALDALAAALAQLDRGGSAAGDLASGRVMPPPIPAGGRGGGGGSRASRY